MEDIAIYRNVSNKLYFESKKESKLNQSMNIKTTYRYVGDNYYYCKNHGKKLN